MGSDASAPAVEISGLSKAYKVGFLHRGRQPALRDVTLKVPRNEIFGYIGPNGSGKTTTLKIVMGLLFADTGSVSVLGRPLEDRSWRYRVGFLPEHPYFYDYLTAAEALDYVGRLFGQTPGERRDRARALLETVELIGFADIPLRRFSKGMVQRFGIAQALMNDPELVFLDEPMSGLDPLGRRSVRDLILELKSRGKTVFFSTHILSDAETLCDRVGVLRSGELTTTGRLDEILSVDVAHMELLVTGLDEAAVAGLPSGLDAHRAVGERWRLQVAEQALGRVIVAVEAAGGRVLSANPVRQSLEDYFFKELGGSERKGEWVMDA